MRCIGHKYALVHCQPYNGQPRYIEGIVMAKDDEPRTEKNTFVSITDVYRAVPNCVLALRPSQVIINDPEAAEGEIKPIARAKYYERVYNTLFKEKPHFTVEETKLLLDKLSMRTDKLGYPDIAELEDRTKYVKAQLDKLVANPDETGTVTKDKKRIPQCVLTHPDLPGIPAENAAVASTDTTEHPLLAWGKCDIPCEDGSSVKTAEPVFETPVHQPAPRSVNERLAELTAPVRVTFIVAGKQSKFVVNKDYDVPEDVIKNFKKFLDEREEDLQACVRSIISTLTEA